MENYISRNMYRRKIKVNCGSPELEYTGEVDSVTGNVLVLQSEENVKIYVAVDKIINFIELG